jgi:hypothetical protein
MKKIIIWKALHIHCPHFTRCGPMHTQIMNEQKGDRNRIPRKLSGASCHDHPAPCRTHHPLYTDTLQCTGAFCSRRYSDYLRWCLHRRHPAGYPDEKTARFSDQVICVDDQPVHMHHRHTSSLPAVSFAGATILRSLGQARPTQFPVYWSCGQYWQPCCLVPYSSL